jgi:hypothetical protein
MFKMFNSAGRIGAWVGIVCGVFGALVGILVVALIPAAWYIKIPILIVVIAFEAGFFAIFYFVFKTTLGPVAEQQELLQSGTPAEATILALEETGITVNNVYPVVKITLEVRPPGGQPYQAKLQTMIDRLDIPQVQPGKVVPVVYDPADPSKVALGSGGGAAGGGAEGGVAGAPSAPGGIAPLAPAGATQKEKARQMEEFLKRNDDESEAILVIGQPAPAVIVQAFPLGVEVNGNNPAMTFMLEVKPEGQTSFQAQVTGVIVEASIPKYQIGKTIYVKYDPADHGRVAIDHS